MKIDQQLLERVDREYRPALANLDVPHPKLLILFSGPPSSGKSTIAKQLERRLRAVRLENDPIRTMAAHWYPASSATERSKLAHDYCDYLWPQLTQETPNGLWVIDSSIDRKYAAVFGFARKYGFKTLVIAIDIPVETHKVWIEAGGDRPFNTKDTYLARMRQRRREQADFLALHKPDLTIRPPYDMRAIVQLVESKLENMT